MPPPLTLKFYFFYFIWGQQKQLGTSIFHLQALTLEAEIKLAFKKKNYDSIYVFLGGP